MRYVPKSKLAFATTALCFLGAISDAGAAGMTGHVVAGKLAIDKVQSAGLRDFLRTNETNFLLGTLFPDAVLLALQTMKNPNADEISHGRKQNNCETPRGIPARFWSKYWQDCPQGPTGSAKCAQDLAFFMGVVTHLVTDGPWHNQYIDIATKGHCSAGRPRIDRPRCRRERRRIIIDRAACSRRHRLRLLSRGGGEGPQN